jgi:hypothetical protein
MVAISPGCGIIHPLKTKKEILMVTSHGLVLVRENSGLRVFAGEMVVTFRGAICRLVSGTPPRHPGSTGRVVVMEDGMEQEFFPSVVGLKWAPVNS